MLDDTAPLPFFTPPFATLMLRYFRCRYATLRQLMRQRQRACYFSRQTDTPLFHAFDAAMLPRRFFRLRCRRCRHDVFRRYATPCHTLH